MRISRRTFLTLLGLTPGLAAAPPEVRLSMCRPRRAALPGSASVAAPAALNPSTLAPFVDPLPIPPIARGQGLRPDPTNSLNTLPYFRIEMREFEAQVHRDLPATRQWGYEGCVPGPTFETFRGNGLLVEWVNALPAAHLLPVDRTLHGAESDKPDVRTVAHVHGAKAPPGSDGYPEQWIRSGQSAVFYYPNDQDAATLWYHDHAMGITRLNLFAGLIGTFLIRDEVEQSLNLPAHERDIPLMLYDRSFDPGGQLCYPVSGDPAAPWVPEFYGNTILCNGRIYPYLEVMPARYRLRLINAANTRFFNLSLSNGAPLLQIGSDSGLLPAPVAQSALQLFPAERADVLVDFSAHAGERIYLHNQAEAVMEFRVARKRPARESPVPTQLRPISRLAAADAVRERVLTLGEQDDARGNSVRMLLDGKHWDDPVSEKPVLDSVEIWSLVNLTGDAHPIHLHLVRFQVLDRRPFDLFAYNAEGKLKYTGAVLPPEPAEQGWKDTVRADAGMVTRIIVRFEGYLGRYVWHCHLLEHEDNEMMRPFEVVRSS
jgi:spore coat protein A